MIKIAEQYSATLTLKIINVGSYLQVTKLINY